MMSIKDNAAYKSALIFAAYGQKISFGELAEAGDKVSE